MPRYSEKSSLLDSSSNSSRNPRKPDLKSCCFGVSTVKPSQTLSRVSQKCLFVKWWVCRYSEKLSLFDSSSNSSRNPRKPDLKVAVLGALPWNRPKPCLECPKSVCLRSSECLGTRKNRERSFRARERCEKLGNWFWKVVFRDSHREPGLNLV